MYFNTIRPTTVFDLLVNIEILLPAIVGGIGTVLGPIVGSFIVIPVSEFVRQSFSVPGLNNAVYGVILIAIVLYSEGRRLVAVSLCRTAPCAHRPVGRRCRLSPNAIWRRSPRSLRRKRFPTGSATGRDSQSPTRSAQSSRGRPTTRSSRSRGAGPTASPAGRRCSAPTAARRSAAGGALQRRGGHRPETRRGASVRRRPPGDPRVARAVGRRRDRLRRQ